MTPAELAALRAYNKARADWHATRRDPHSPRHHAARIAADDAAAAYYAARMMAHGATQDTTA